MRLSSSLHSNLASVRMTSISHTRRKTRIRPRMANGVSPTCPNGKLFNTSERERADSRLRLQVAQQIGIDRVGLGRTHPMRKPFIGLQRRGLEELRSQRTRIRIRHDLI